MGEGISNVEQDLFEEKAAICEFDGGQDRESAERAAREEVEQHRFRCEVSYVLRLAHQHGSDRSDSYLFNVERQRGAEPSERLRAAAKDQWIKGNRGEAFQWL